MQKLHVLTFVFSSIVFSQFALAQDYSAPLQKDEILVESKQDLSLPYKKRRKDFGVLLSFNYERYYPAEHVSIIQDKTYEEISGGEPVPMMGLELGLKYNFVLGSLAAIAGYSQGQFAKEENNLDDVNVSITKFDLNFALDNLLSEPWVVPYAQAGIHQIEWEENSYTGADNIIEGLRTKPSYHYKVGMLFQLNWIENHIDPNTNVEGLRSSGLENTFIDVFYTSYNAFAETEPVEGAATTAEGDADLSSSEMGVGLKLEF